MNRSALQGLERTLLALGLILAVWSMLAALQRGYHASLSVRGPVARELPGDALREPGSLEPPTTAAPPGSVVARIEAPRINFSAAVLEGSTDAVLARGAGHIEGTALPGGSGNVGIAGHRDTTFRPVQHLEVGDRLRVTTAGGQFEYRVVRTWVVHPRDVHVLDATVRPSLTLVTCYPFRFVGPAPRRYIVRAELVTPEAKPQPAAR